MRITITAEGALARELLETVAYRYAYHAVREQLPAKVQGRWKTGKRAAYVAEHRTARKAAGDALKAALGVDELPAVRHAELIGPDCGDGRGWRVSSSALGEVVQDWQRALVTAVEAGGELIPAFAEATRAILQQRADYRATWEAARERDKQRTPAERVARAERAAKGLFGL